MTALYAYNGLTGLTAEQLFLWIAIDQALSHLGGTDAAAAASLLLGTPTKPPPSLAPSVQRVDCAKANDLQFLSLQLAALPEHARTGAQALKDHMKRCLDAVAMRTLPVAGWVLIRYDAVQILLRATIVYNASVRGGDALR
jgi:hypothetical protein